MNTTLEDAMIIEMAEIAEVRLQHAFIRHCVEVEFASQIVRMDHEQVVSVGVAEWAKYG